MTTDEDQPVLLHVDAGLATITLNRPAALNALNLPAKRALLDALRAVADDPAVRAVVLTGTGRAFCVGQDLRDHAALIASGDAAPLSTVSEHFNPLVTLLATMPKPVVAAVNGTAAGAGLGLAAACDLRIGTAGARYTTAFAGIGLTADSGLSWTLPRLVGVGRAAALLLLADPFSSEQALEMGFLHQLVTAEELPAAADALGRRLAQGPTVAYACLKASVAHGLESSLPSTLAREDELQTVAGATADHVNAVHSFIAKNPPVFEGR